jgi:hypothetical protein
MGLEIRKIIERKANSMGTCTLKVKIDLEPVVLSLNKKDLETVEIHAEINHILGEDAIVYSTVMRYLRKQSFADSSALLPGDREIQAPGAIDNAILQALDKQCFASLRHIAKRILVPTSTV